jgi:hypothetical protein
MLTAYIDETGTDPNQFAFNFAGWVSKQDEWDKFSDEWLEALQKKPSILYFKHYEAKSQSGQFKGWPSSACDRKILALAKVIARHDSYGVITGVRNEVVARLLKAAIPSVKTVRSILGMSRPYDLCFQSIIATILQYQVNAGDSRRINFVFDEGDSAFESCSKLYRELRDKWPFPPALKAIAGTVTRGNDKQLMPLQAADLLAGQSTVKLRGKNAMERPYKLLARQKKILFSPIKWGDPVLANLAEIVQVLNLVWYSKNPGKVH